MRGLLIVNLGTPASFQPKDVRRFLRTFLSDPRVIDLPKLLWQPILHCAVLPFRARKSAKLYRSIWTKSGSPLVIYTRRQCNLLAQALPEWHVEYAMTYTEPSIPAALDAMQAAGVSDLTVLPLYPQWAPSSAGAITDQVLSHFHRAPTMPTLRIIGAWPTEPAFIAWHADRIAASLAAHPSEKRVQQIICSYHGVPNRDSHRAAGYRSECEATTAAIAQALANRGVQIPVKTTFQSKFGPGEWLAPATIDTIAKLPRAGVTSVLVSTPGFIADCVETLEELDVQNQNAFKGAGGKFYVRVPPINDDPAFVQVVRNLIF